MTRRHTKHRKEPHNMKYECLKYGNENGIVYGTLIKRGKRGVVTVLYRKYVNAIHRFPHYNRIKILNVDLSIDFAVISTLPQK